jgi:zinc finger protein
MYFKFFNLKGTLGGIYTTVEGLVKKILENLKDNIPWVGDSDVGTAGIMKKLFARLDSLANFGEKFTLIIDDPLDNSFI